MGIDYGRGLTNIDLNTGIRFGVIHQNEVKYWFEESEMIYPEPEHSDDCESYGDNHFDDCSCNDFSEPIGSTYEKLGYIATQIGDCGDIFVIYSPYYTICGFCSPCAPGAGYLLTRSEDCKAYCFGADWFENGNAPYDIYSVETNKKVYSKEVE